MTREELEEITRQVAGEIKTQLESSEKKKGETISDLMNRWIGNVRTYDGENQNNPFFRAKPRAHGQADGSTDGRLRRKLIMKVAENYAIDKNETDNEKLNKSIAKKLGNFLPLLTSQPIKKAFYLTAEKLRDPLGYKQKFARIVPFGKDDEGNDHLVKASRRFHIITTKDLPLKTYMKNGKETIVKTSMPEAVALPNNLTEFGQNTSNLMDDVGQIGLGECMLQSAAASLPRSRLGNMFSWSPAYRKNGVTIRLHDKKGIPMYIRLQNDQLGHDKSAHRAMWPYVLSAAAAKIGDAKIQNLRRSKEVNPGEYLYDSYSGLPIYSLQDVDGMSLGDAAMLLTGKYPDKNETIDIDSFDMPVSKRGEEMEKLWNNTHSTNSPNVSSRMGVASLNNMNIAVDPNDLRPHAVLWQNYDPKTRKATFINPWDETEINKLNKSKISAEYLTKQFSPRNFAHVVRAGFLPQVEHLKHNYVNRTTPLGWRMKELRKTHSGGGARLGNFLSSNGTRSADL